MIGNASHSMKGSGETESKEVSNRTVGEDLFDVSGRCGEFTSKQHRWAILTQR